MDHITSRGLVLRALCLPLLMCVAIHTDKAESFFELPLLLTPARPVPTYARTKRNELVSPWFFRLLCCLLVPRYLWLG